MTAPELHHQLLKHQRLVQQQQEQEQQQSEDLLDTAEIDSQTVGENKTSGDQQQPVLTAETGKGHQQHPGVETDQQRAASQSDSDVEAAVKPGSAGRGRLRKMSRSSSKDQQSKRRQPEGTPGEAKQHAVASSGGQKLSKKQKKAHHHTPEGEIRMMIQVRSVNFAVYRAGLQPARTLCVAAL